MSKKNRKGSYQVCWNVLSAVESYSYLMQYRKNARVMEVFSPKRDWRAYVFLWDDCAPEECRDPHFADLLDGGHYRIINKTELREAAMARIDRILR